MTNDDNRVPWDQVVAEDHTNPAYVAEMEAAAARQQRAHDGYYVSLAGLRRAQALTQVQLARSLGISQAEASRIEHQADLLLSTLASYITAAGGPCSGGGHRRSCGCRTPTTGDTHPLSPTPRS